MWLVDEEEISRGIGKHRYIDLSYWRASERTREVYEALQHKYLPTVFLSRTVQFISLLINHKWGGGGGNYCEFSSDRSSWEREREWLRRFRVRFKWLTIIEVNGCHTTARGQAMRRRERERERSRNLLCQLATAVPHENIRIMRALKCLF